MVGMTRVGLLRAITFLGGLYFVLEFLLPETVLERVGLNAYHDAISYGFITVGAVAFGLGLINLFSYHGRKIIFRRQGAFYSATLLIGLAAMLMVGAAEWYASAYSAPLSAEFGTLSAFAQAIEKNASDPTTAPKNLPPFSNRVAALVKAGRAEIEKAALLAQGKDQKELAPLMAELRAHLNTVEQNPETLKDKALVGSISSLAEGISVIVGKWERARYETSTVKYSNDFLVLGLFTSLGSAMFSLLAVYIASAAYRAFRVRSFESFLMMSAAVIVILGQTFLGLLIWDEFPAIRLWLMEVPNSAAFRAIKLGAAIAGLVMAFRMWLSIESSSFSEGEPS